MSSGMVRDYARETKTHSLRYGQGVPPFPLLSVADIGRNVQSVSKYLASRAM